MLISKTIRLGMANILTLSILLSGCNLSPPLKKTDIGPAGVPIEEKSTLPLTERFLLPPKELYDLEATAGVIFEGILKNDWIQATTGLSTLQALWPQSKILIGDKKGVSAATTALDELTISISSKNPLASYENLNKFMASIADIGKAYQLSPLPDIIAVDNAIRRVCFYAMSNDWHKATAKMKELENTWGQTKPTMESVGILGKITTTHSTIKQMKDAVEAENKEAVKTTISKINESMAYIREYYRAK